MFQVIDDKMVVVWEELQDLKGVWCRCHKTFFLRLHFASSSNKLLFVPGLIFASKAGAYLTVPHS